MASDPALPSPARELVYNSPLQWVICAPHAIDRLPQAAGELGLRRLIVICGRNSRETRAYRRALQVLGNLCVARFEAVPEHSSVEACEAAAAMARAHAVDGIVAIGGGSTSDTAKAVAILLGEGGRLDDHTSVFRPPDHFVHRELRAPKLPIIAIPGTASGAEVTPGAGVRTAAGHKLLFWDHKLAARLILLDPDANLEVPLAVMAASAMNALAHCVEAHYSRLANPISDGLALHGARLLGKAIPAMMAAPHDADARRDLLIAAHVAALAFSNTRTCLHHAVCHCLGSAAGMSHGLANAVMLPQVIEYNLDFARPQIEALAAAIGQPANDSGAGPAEAFRALQRIVGAPPNLRLAGVDKADLPKVAEKTFNERGILFNPRPITDVAQIMDLLEAAW